jgi:heparanase 1
MNLVKSEDILNAEGPGLDAFSYHFYGAVSKRCARMGVAGGTTPEAALTVDWLSRTNHDEEFYAALRDRFTPGKPIWLTETGETACGGDPWAPDFIDTFRYLNQLGSLARRSVQVVMHNTLNASDYALIDEATLTPRPNYWAAVLWRRLMGTTVLNAGESHAEDLYLYAHCLRNKPGGVAILAINTDKSGAHDVELPVKSMRYSLTSSDLMSSTVQLNGVELALTSDGDLPPINGVALRAGHVSLSPASITFLAIPEAHNAACR